MWELFDVLMDGEYRPLWDTHMVESFTLGYINPNNDIGYYASEFYFAHIAIIHQQYCIFFIYPFSVVSATNSEP